MASRDCSRDEEPGLHHRCKDAASSKHMLPPSYGLDSLLPRILLDRAKTEDGVV